MRKRIIGLAHESHQGIVHTKQSLSEMYWWPKMDLQTETNIKHCSVCRQHDKTLDTHTAPLQLFLFQMQHGKRRVWILWDPLMYSYGQKFTFTHHGHEFHVNIGLSIISWEWIWNWNCYLLFRFQCLDPGRTIVRWRRQGKSFLRWSWDEEPLRELGRLIWWHWKHFSSWLTRVSSRQVRKF